MPTLALSARVAPELPDQPTEHDPQGSDSPLAANGERCQTRICHRLTNHEDINLAKNILNMDDPEKAIIIELSNREALVKTEYNAQPFLVQISDPDLSLLNRREEETPIEEDILEIVSPTEEDKL